MVGRAGVYLGALTFYIYIYIYPVIPYAVVLRLDKNVARTPKRQGVRLDEAD